MKIASGARLGPYEIVAPLGAGGMGEVYRARDTRLDRPVAVKVLPESLASDPERMRRFEQEARAAGALNHPNVMSVYDVGSLDGRSYIVTELLEGQTLRERLSGGALPPRTAVELAAQIARGLAAAHEKGIVHRDLKPENLFVTRDGHLKILDFGLAKFRPEASATEKTVTTPPSGLTAEGIVLGTAGYMSPEQVRGQQADARSDIFALGCVLYEMTWGRRAFGGDTSAEVMAAILKDDPPDVHVPAMPAALPPVVRRCLAKDPRARFASAHDLALILDALSAPSAPDASAAPAGGRAAPRMRSRERAAWAAAAALLVVAALLGVKAARGPAARAAAHPPLRFTVAPPPGSSFTGMMALSPDAGSLAFVATDSEGRDVLWVRSLGSLEARPLAGSEGAEFPFWSPDSRDIAFFAHGKLQRVSVSGSEPARTLCPAGNPRGGAWSRSGVILFSVNAGGEIDSVPAVGGPATTVLQVPGKPTQSFRWPSFLPDGRHFLYAVLSADRRVAGIHVGSLDSPDTRQLVPTADSGAIYAAPGWLLYRSGNQLMRQAFDGTSGRLSGAAAPLVEGVWWDGLTTLLTAFTVSDTGLLAYQSGGLAQSELVWFGRSGRPLGRVGPPGAYLEPTLSTDGGRLAVTRADPQTGEVAAWMLDLERGTAGPVSGSGFGSTPLWSPDGRRVVYSDFPSGDVVASAVGSPETASVLFKLDSFAPLDDWSADGRYLYYEVIDWKTFRGDIWVRDLQSPGRSRPVVQSPADEANARVTADGKWMAYQADDSGVTEVYVCSASGSGGRWQVSVGGGTQPRWRADGRELYYIAPDRKVMAVTIGSSPEFKAGLPRELFQTQILPLVEARNQYDVTRDGSRFIVNSRRAEDATLPITVVVDWAEEIGR
ncbi:MAG TPA: protein kinase [Thermoanaerobaculaceae bacterium]|nr:protein kinase [Thermoanaerobaculaceae bacterium]